MSRERKAKRVGYRGWTAFPFSPALAVRTLGKITGSKAIIAPKGRALPNQIGACRLVGAFWGDGGILRKTGFHTPGVVTVS